MILAVCICVVKRKEINQTWKRQQYALQTLKVFWFYRFVPFEYIIEENHPYLAGKTLEAHIQQGTLFVVDLSEISLNEQKVSLHCYINPAYQRENGGGVEWWI